MGFACALPRCCQRASTPSPWHLSMSGEEEEGKRKKEEGEQAVTGGKCAGARRHLRRRGVWAQLAARRDFRSLSARRRSLALAYPVMAGVGGRHAQHLILPYRWARLRATERLSRRGATTTCWFMLNSLFLKNQSIWPTCAPLSVAHRPTPPSAELAQEATLPRKAQLGSQTNQRQPTADEDTTSL
jgi:hypothetical protein